MLQAPHEAPSNAVDFDITHRPLPLERSVVYLTSASVRLIRPGSGAFPIHWTGRLSPRDLLRLGPWKLPSATILHTSTSCLTTAAALARRTGSGSWCTQRTGRSCFRNVYRWICERGRTISRAAIGLLSTTPGRSTNSNTVLFDELQT